MPQRRPGHKAPSGPPTGRGFCFDSRSSWPGLAFPNSHFVVSPSLPGLTRQSITFVKDFVKIDGCPGQARARRVCLRAHQPQFQTATLFAATASRSRRTCASFALNIATLQIRGRRECRAPAAPAVSRAKVESTRVSHHGHTGLARHSPRNGFNGFLRAPR
jgi:hypothetical protein